MEAVVSAIVSIEKHDETITDAEQVAVSGLIPSVGTMIRAINPAASKSGVNG